MLLTDPNFSLNFYLECCYEHKDWYESFSSHSPTPEFLSVARSVFPDSWTLHSGGVWTNVAPPNGHSNRRQGWKLHISATQENALKILERSVRGCVDCEVPFKFLSDPFVFDMVLGKGSFRESSGKFITIYPSDESHFKRIAECLYQKLSDFEGPYTLSDKPYKDSQVIFYRYGAFRGWPRMSVFGVQEILLRSPSGELVPDGRSAYFNPPSWALDPLEESRDAPAESDEMTIYLKEGRYRVESAIHFSLTGGVYKALDLDSGKTVIIKEARHHTSRQPTGEDAIARLEKEYRLLKKLSGTGITPEPIDIFFDWKHLFLVEEFLPGQGLYSLVSNLSQDNIEKNIDIENIYNAGVSLAYAVKVLHDHNIILNDVSSSNVIYSDTEETFKLIDLEAALAEGIDSPFKVGTI